MFNTGYKKETIAGLKEANNKYQRVYGNTIDDIVRLHDKRVTAVKLIKQIEGFINSLVNTPKEFQKFLGEIKVNRHKFETEVHNLELESKSANKVSGSVAGAGMAAGVGVAAFGPTAAMAIATTFGTASTGTAIATLSGAAATNAALAWLGGGALVASGGGIAAGEALLALAGPVGWAIGGTALLGGGLLANNKNKKIAEKAEAETKTVKNETNKLLKLRTKVESVFVQTIEMSEHLNSLLKKITKNGINDYRSFSDEQLEQIKTLLNVTMSLSSKLCEKVN
jgi:hypothetical protein